MRFHHLDLGPPRPLGGPVDGGTSPGAVARPTCRCLPAETPRDGLVLVDAGFGQRDLREIPGLPPEFLLPPLPGHTPGHAGVALRGPRGWLLHAGDAAGQRASLARLRAMLGAPDAAVAVFRSHDAVDSAAMAAWSESGDGTVAPDPVAAAAG